MNAIQDPTTIQRAREFAEHEITAEPPAKCWKVNKPGTWIYGFFITFSPGVLTLSGDVGELVITHYHAMPTLDEALRWLTGIEFDYLMSKSSVRREYSSKRSLQCLIALANEDQKYDPEAPLWSKIFREFEDDVEPGHDNHRHKAHQAKLIAALKDANCLQVSNLAEICQDAYIEDWPGRTRCQFDAIMCWHRLVTAAPKERRKIANRRGTATAEQERAWCLAGMEKKRVGVIDRRNSGARP